MSQNPLVPREELESVLAARRELGPEREQELVESFLERVERNLERRGTEQAPMLDRGHEQRRFVLALASVAVGVPLTAIALGTSGLAALAIVWAGVVLVNFAYARRGF